MTATRATGARWDGTCHAARVTLRPLAQTTRGGLRRRRAVGGILLGACLASFLALATKDTPNDPTLNAYAGTLYSWTSWVLAGSLALAGLVLLVGSGGPSALLHAAAAVGLVAAAQLSGTGVVAVKHWQPYTGMQGSGAHLPQLRLLAAAMACAGLASAGAVVWLLVAEHALPSGVGRWARTASVVAGLAIAVVVPLGMGAGDPQTMDFTSLGAYALIYGLPWGGAVLLSAWLTRAAALAALGAVLASIALALVGPQMEALLYSAVTGPFVAALLLCSTAFAVRVRFTETEPAGVGLGVA